MGVRILSRYDDELTGGVHNVYIYDNHVYDNSVGILVVLLPQLTSKISANTKV